MFIYPNDKNSKTPGDWVQAEEADDDEDDYTPRNYDPNRPVMHLRRVEGIELIWCRFRDRFFPETEGECDD